MEQIDYYEYETPVGLLTLGCIDDDVVECHFGKKEGQGLYRETEGIKKAYLQLQEYFEGKRKTFDLNFRFLIGTEFQQKVWKALLTIPYGETASYKDIAEMVGSPRAYRAIGGANNKNPIVLFVPCHRIIGANKQLVGYGGGLDKKVYLLDLEAQYK